MKVLIAFIAGLVTAFLASNATGLLVGSTTAFSLVAIAPPIEEACRISALYLLASRFKTSMRLPALLAFTVGIALIEFLWHLTYNNHFQPPATFMFANVAPFVAVALHLLNSVIAGRFVRRRQAPAAAFVCIPIHMAFNAYVVFVFSSLPPWAQDTEIPLRLLLLLCATYLVMTRPEADEAS